MTGMWENALSKIESGEMNPDTFHKSTEVHASQITSELLGVQLTLSTQQDLTCPKCGTGRILLYPKVAKCDNTDCGLVIFRNKSDKQLTDKQVTELVTAKKTGMIKGFKSKAGKPFDASLAFDDHSFSLKRKGNQGNNLKFRIFTTENSIMNRFYAIRN